MGDKESSALGITPTFTFSRDLMEGLNLFAGLNSSEGVWDNHHTLHIPMNTNEDFSFALRNVDVTVSYGLVLGPGNLSLALRNRIGVVLAATDNKSYYGHETTKDSFKDEIRVDAIYGLPLADGTLSAGVFTGVSIQPGRMKDNRIDDLVFDYDQLGITLGYAAGGFRVDTETGYTISTDSDVDFGYSYTWWDLGYGTETYSFGVEGQTFVMPVSTGGGGGFLVSGLTIVKPYVEFYSFYPGLTAGVYLKVMPSVISNTYYNFGALSPGFYAKYKF
jgi:hypothetical protein